MNDLPGSLPRPTPRGATTDDVVDGHLAGTLYVPAFDLLRHVAGAVAFWRESER
jgi:hypothetical protein